MRKYLLIFTLLFSASAALAQTITFTDSTAQRTGWIGPGFDVTHDTFDSQPLVSYPYQDPGFEPFAYSSLISVNTKNVGSTTFFNTGQTFAYYVPNELAGGTYTHVRNGAVVGTGTITSNSGGGSSNLTAVLSGSTIGSVTVNTASLPGLPNGTYTAYVTGGSGSGGNITYTVSGSTCVGGTTGCTGGTITAAVTAAGTGYATPPEVNIVNTIVVTATSASGGFQNTTGDYVIARKTFIPTTQTQWPSLGWSVSGTVNAETTDLPVGDLPPGTANTQAMVLDGVTSGTSSATSDWDAGGGEGGQNHVLMTGPLAGVISGKVQTGTGTLHWSVSRGATGGFSCSGTMALTTTWQVFSFGSSCSPNETSSATGPWGTVQVSFSISGAVADIDDVAIQDTAYNTNGTAFSDPTVTAAQTYNGGPRILDDQLTMPLSQILQPDLRGESPYGFGEGCNAGQPAWTCDNLPVITLPMALGLRNKIANGKPLWYVVPATLNKADTTESATLVQYLGGTCSVGYPTCTCGTTGASIRCQQNHATPYLPFSDGAELDLEIGNENWNGANAGEKWLYVPALGNNEYTPYGYAAQDICSNAKADSTYLSAEDFVIGAQTAGAGTTFSMDSLAKSGTGISLSCDTIAQAPYWGFGNTSGGYNTSTPITLQAESSHAEVYNNANNSGGTLKTLFNAAYPFKLQLYETNGSAPTSPATGVPTQPELHGYQNGWGAGLANLIQSFESCAGSNFCGFQGMFSMLQFNQTASNATFNSFTATTTNGSNTITGISSTTNLDIGVHLGSIGGVISGSNINYLNGTTAVLSQSASASGSQTFTTANPNLSGYVWGCWTGMGAQNYNFIRADCVGQQVQNAVIPAGSSMITSAWTSQGTQAFTGVNGVPTQAAVPKQYAYGFKKGTNRTYVLICDDWTGATCSFTIAGAAISGTVTKTLLTSTNLTDINEQAFTVAPVTSSVSMPTTYVAPAFSMTTFQGTTGGVTVSGIAKGGNTATGGNSAHQ